MHLSEKHVHLSRQIHHELGTYPTATVALSLKDPSDGFSFHLNEHRVFHAASLMKVPVMIEVYKQVAKGRLSLTDDLEIRNQFTSAVDNSSYQIEEDSDDQLHALIGRTMSIQELVDRMITISSNLATNLLIDQIDIPSITATLNSLGVHHTPILRGVEDLKAFEQGVNNTTTSNDMTLLLEHLLVGQNIPRDQADAMISILLNQTDNAMIPAGLPANTRVAHKTGQISRVHHDAGIIYPTQSSPFILTILIEGIEQLSVSAQLGAKLTRVVNRLIRS